MDKCDAVLFALVYSAAFIKIGLHYTHPFKAVFSYLIENRHYILLYTIDIILYYVKNNIECVFIIIYRIDILYSKFSLLKY